MNASQGFLYSYLKTFIRERLVQEVDGIEIEAVESILGIGSREDEPAFVGQFVGDLQPVQAVHLNIEEYQVGLATTYFLQAYARLTEGCQLHSALSMAKLFNNK